MSSSRGRCLPLPRTALAGLVLAGLASGLPGYWVSVAWAQSPTASTPAAAPITALNTALATAEKDSAMPFQKRYDALAPAIDHAFDLPQILHTIVGLRWPSIPAANQAKLLTAFRAFTIASYASNFNSDSGDAFTLLPETRAVGADQVVETEIVPKEGDRVRIDYVMRNVNGAWMAVDVLQQGTISQAAVQRSDFRSLLANDATGGALIDSLTQRVGKLSGGAIHP